MGRCGMTWFKKEKEKTQTSTKEKQRQKQRRGIWGVQHMTGFVDKKQTNSAAQNGRQLHVSPSSRQTQRESCGKTGVTAFRQ